MENAGTVGNRSRLKGIWMSGLGLLRCISCCRDRHLHLLLLKVQAVTSSPSNRYVI